MVDEPALSTLLPARTVRLLNKNNINTIGDIKNSYPEKLLRIDGFGMYSLRAVEAAFFPDQKYVQQSRPYTRGRGMPTLSEDLSNYLRSVQSNDDFK